MKIRLSSSGRLARLFESTGGVLPHEASASITLMAPILLLAPSPQTYTKRHH